jgi:hypothetical protein
LVPEERNPKGIALFAMAHLDRFAATGRMEHRKKAERLLEWLRANSAPGYDRPCWGYNFDWQNGRKFFLPAYEPAIVVSVFCGRAFLEHYRCTGRASSLTMARRTVEAIRSTINTEIIENHTVYGYTPYDRFTVINANALAAGFFTEVATAQDDRDLLDHAAGLTEFVIDAQTEEGAWFYAMPASESHLSHDSFHTGFVLESLYHCLRATGRTDTDALDRPAVERAYRRGIEFYREELFEDDGAPKFEHDTPYPRDVHAAAQAIRTFGLDGSDASRRVARRVIDWTLEHLYDDAGYFYRRRGRLVDDTTPYMRWSQGWMCFALASYLRQHEHERRDDSVEAVRKRIERADRDREEHETRT